MSQGWEKNEAIREKYSNQQKIPKTVREYAAKYSWIVMDKNDDSHIFCKFCKYSLSTRPSNIRMHQYSSKHIQNTKDIDKSEVEREQILPSKRLKSCGKREFAAIYSWAMVDKTDDSYVICKMCNWKINAWPSNVRRHQYSIRHMLSTKEIDPSDVEREQILPSKRHKSYGKERLAAKYSWVVVDKTDDSYVICKLCNWKINAWPSKVRRHQYSIRHMLSSKKIDPSDVERGQISPINERRKSCGTGDFVAKYSWVVVDKNDDSYVFCKFCKCRIGANSTTIRRHQYSRKHIRNTKDIDKSDVEQERIPEREETSTNSNDPDLQMHSNSDDDFDEQSYGHNASPSPNNSSDMIRQTQSFDFMVEIPSSHNVRTTTDITAEEAKLEPKMEQSDVEQEQIPENPESPKITDNFNDTAFHSYGDDQNTSPSPNNPPDTLLPAESIDYPVTPTDNTPDQATPIQVEPWKIIISKVRGAEPPTQAVSPVKSTATVTPLPITTQQYRESAVSSPSRSNHNVKDSFDLLFESVCATLKSLPPKLATEGKIRVIQLIGELEMRAIEEQDHNP